LAKKKKKKSIGQIIEFDKEKKEEGIAEPPLKALGGRLATLETHGAG
jgi:hypothetical protein